MMRRRDFLASMTVTARVGAAARKPNIIFAMFDDMGYADAGCYGQKTIQTPTIDRLAREGMRFTDCYAGGAVCAPSRCTLMTGRHTGHAAVRANAYTMPLPASEVTVAEVLRQAGYRSGIFGKWGLGDAGSPGMPTRQGFDEAFGYLHQIHAHTYYPEFLWDGEAKHPLPGNAGGARKQYSAEWIAARARAFVRKNQDRPFFLYFATTLPHAAYEIPSDAPYSNRDWPQEDKNYAAMVTLADSHLGAILDEVRECGLEQDTIVFFTSDNGAPRRGGSDRFSSCGPLRGFKGELYEGGIRVPMVVRWPGRIAAGRVSELPWAFWDFLPTAAEIAGAPVPGHLDGISMLPALLGKPQTPHEYLYWEHHGFDGAQGRLRPGSMQQAVRVGDWKGVRNRPGAPLELYNLREDIGEKKNLAQANARMASRIEEMMRAAHTEPGPHSGGRKEYVS